MHDDTQPARVYEMTKVLKSGQIPPRWVPDLGYGYGYPLFEFYGPLPYVVGAVGELLGMPLVPATNTMLFVGMALGFITSLMLGVYLFGWLGGLVCATLYQYAPYHAIQLYVRGAVGEMYAYGFLPLVVFGIWKIAREKTHRSGIIWTVVGLTGMILSHTIYGYLSVGTILVGSVASIGYGMVIGKRDIRRVGLSIFVSVCLSLAVTAFFWLPAIAEKSATNVTKVVGSDSAELTDHFVCPSQFWQSPWGFGGSAAGCDSDGMSFKLGKLQILGGLGAGLLYGFYAITKKKSLKKQTKRIDVPDSFHTPLFIGTMLTIGSVFFMLSPSATFWKLIPMSSFVQYPWRLLPVTALGLALLSGMLIVMIPKKIIMYALAGILSGVVIYQGATMFVPKYTYIPEPGIFSSESDLKWRVSKISDEYMPPGFIAPKYKESISGMIITSQMPFTVNSARDENTHATVCMTLPSTATVRINKATFPGWTYTIDKKPVNVSIVAGLPQTVVSEGSHCIELVLTRTPARLIADIVSVVILIGGLLYVITKKTNT
jgi:hypothetical protein